MPIAARSAPGIRGRAASANTAPMPILTSTPPRAQIPIVTRSRTFGPVPDAPTCLRYSATLAVECGDLAYGLGDGAEVLTQDRTVVAGDLRADLDVRVAGGHRVEAGAYPFLLVAAASEGRPRRNHIPYWDGDVVQHGGKLALAGEPAELDVAVRLLFGGHPRGQARR